MKYFTTLAIITPQRNAKPTSAPARIGWSGPVRLPKALAEWIRDHIKSGIEPRLAALTHREAIRAQAIGDAFDGDRLQSIARYETHLDRRLERTLAVLVKLQELRKARERYTQLESRLGL